MVTEATPNVWSEPLTARSEDQTRHTFATVVTDATGKPLAGVVCAVNREAHTLWVGDMKIGARDSTARQNIRLLVLLAREMFRYAAELGVTHARTVTPASMAPLARRVSGLAGVPLDDGRVVFQAKLAEVRTHALKVTDATGNLA